ncbi:SAVED domain-containing protein [Bacillus cereus]|uniref:SAVED domain-containing protein n=1 Tax=Bacillus cereus TaxID=1396 RepID=UPI003018062D
MSVSHIPQKIKLRLWGKAAGRCQYEGCNKPLWYDSLTKEEFNTSYIAHIIADQPDGPRGDKELSKQLKDDIDNLMLMCDEHHRLIDREDVSGHSVERLQGMKKKHEEQMAFLTSLLPDRQSHILLYGANIGQNYAPLSWKKAKNAMYPEKYPAEKTAIELGMKNSSFVDREEIYWQIERENLRRQFNDKVKLKLGSGEIEHMSVFALAPQPLLMELGRLLSDIPAGEVFQLHREPADWLWQNGPDEFEYYIKRPEKIHEKVAINLSLSATIDDSRITNVLGNEVSIWNLTINEPYNDFLKSKDQLRIFRETFRKLMDLIKKTHGHNNILHVFPAVPVSIAVEIGRVWMPKADLPLIVYDENRNVGGFAKAIEITAI